jgi:hypothetical protein
MTDFHLSWFWIIENDLQMRKFGHMGEEITGKWQSRDRIELNRV